MPPFLSEHINTVTSQDLTCKVVRYDLILFWTPLHPSFIWNAFANAMFLYLLKIWGELQQPIRPSTECSGAPALTVPQGLWWAGTSNNVISAGHVWCEQDRYGFSYGPRGELNRDSFALDLGLAIIVNKQKLCTMYFLLLCCSQVLQ